jgi:hypothetical protein
MQDSFLSYMPWQVLYSSRAPNNAERSPVLTFEVILKSSCQAIENFSGFCPLWLGEASLVALDFADTEEGFCLEPLLLLALPLG